MWPILLEADSKCLVYLLSFIGIGENYFVVIRYALDAELGAFSIALARLSLVLDLDLFLRLLRDFDEGDLVGLKCHRDEHHEVFGHFEFVIEMLLLEDVHHGIDEGCLGLRPYLSSVILAW